MQEILFAFGFLFYNDFRGLALLMVLYRVTWVMGVWQGMRIRVELESNPMLKVSLNRTQSIMHLNT
jgi:hypothetical protein